MQQNHAARVFRQWDTQRKYVFTNHELHKLFPEDSPKTLAEGLNRLVAHQILMRACRGIYVNLHATHLGHYTIEYIAKGLRPGAYTYVSLESLLSEYGIISQIPIDRLTLMTTGRSGLYHTPFGTIEYTHTKRDIMDILPYIQQVPDRPLRLASPQMAWRDLKRVGRNIHMINQAELHEYLKK
jgi:hypothetical protein